MHVSSKKFLVAACGVVAAGLFSGQAVAKTVGYPGPEHPSFTVTVPDSWTVTPGHEVGDYMDLDDGNGVTMQMRTIEATQESLAAAVKDSEDYINESYTDVQLTAPANSEMNGLKVSTVTGTGKDKEGNPVKIGMAWFLLKDGNLGEVWYAADAEDKDGIAEAGKVFASYRAP